MSRIAKKNLYFDRDGTMIVPLGDKRASRLYVREGEPVDDAVVKQYKLGRYTEESGTTSEKQPDTTER